MRKTVLVVDDARIIRKLLGKYLNETDYEIIGEAEDGEEAISMYTDLKPDYVTLDIIMPKMNGLEVLKRIKTFDPKAQVIVITAMSQDSLAQKAMNLGAIAIIKKPFSKQEIMGVFNQISKG